MRSPETVPFYRPHIIERIVERVGFASRIAQKTVLHPIVCSDFELTGPRLLAARFDNWLTTCVTSGRVVRDMVKTSKTGRLCERFAREFMVTGLATKAIHCFPATNEKASLPSRSGFSRG